MTNLPSLFSDFDRNMTFGSWRPLLRQLDDVFNDVWGVRQSDGQRFSPLCDVRETEQQFVVSFDMPGIDRNQVDIEVQGNQLVVRGERKDEKKSQDSSDHVTERYYGKFERMITLPENIETSKIEATLDNGVLTMVVPKVEAAKRQKIKISEGKPGILKNILGRKDEKEGETKSQSKDQVANQ